MTKKAKPPEPWVPGKSEIPKAELESLVPAKTRAALVEAVKRLEREGNAALADDLAGALGAKPTVIRDKLRTLRNDLYRLNDTANDWWDIAQRAEAEAAAIAAFGEKLEDLLPGIKRSRKSRERQPEIEARRVELDVLILAEVSKATATVLQRWPDSPPKRGLVNEEIAAALKLKSVKIGGRAIGIRRIEQARKGR